MDHLQPRLKIAAADAAGSPYFHAGWSRRAAGFTIWKIVREVYAAAERVFRHFPDRLLACVLSTDHPPRSVSSRVGLPVAE